MSSIELGKLKHNVEPPSLAGAAIFLETGPQQRFILATALSSQSLTADVLSKLDARGVVEWVPGGREAAAGGPLPATPAGMPRTEDEYSPMLDPKNPPEPFFPPDKPAVPPRVWTLLTYGISVLVVPSTIFFLYATLSEKVLTLGDALTSFGPAGWLLSLAAGAGVGYGVNVLAKTRGSE